MDTSVATRRVKALDNLAKSPHTRSGLSVVCTVAKVENIFRPQARLLKALANKSRLLIIDRLNDGQCSAGELVAPVGTDASTVSKHLSLFRSHGLVGDSRGGTTVYYQHLTPCVVNFFACATQVLRERA